MNRAFDFSGGRGTPGKGSGTPSSGGGGAGGGRAAPLTGGAQSAGAGQSAADRGRPGAGSSSRQASAEKKHYGEVSRLEDAKSVAEKAAKQKSRAGKSTARRGGAHGEVASAVNVLLILGPRGRRLRESVESSKAWINEASGDTCHVMQLGDPRASSDEFLALIGRSSALAKRIKGSTAAGLKRYGSSKVATDYREHEAARSVGLDLQDLPCALVFPPVSGAEPIPLGLPGDDELPEGGGSRVAALIKEMFSSEALQPILVEGFEVDESEGMQALSRHLKECAAKLRAEHREPSVHRSVTQEAILSVLHASGERRLVTRAIAERLNRGEKSLGKELSGLVQERLVDNVRDGKNRGYKLTHQGRIAFEKIETL